MRTATAKSLLKKVIEDYGNISENFSKTRQNEWEGFKLFLKYIKNSDKIADIGCGNGRFLKFLKQHKTADYIGIDNNEKLLDEAKKQMKENFIFGDFLKIPLENNSVDTVVAIASFHHIPSYEPKSKALNEVRRILKNDGIFIITVWNLFQPKYKEYIFRAYLRSIFTLGKYDSRDTFIPWSKSEVKRYYYAFKPKELESILKKHKFEILKKHIDRNITFICKKTCQQKVKILKVNFNNTTLKKAAEKVILWAKEKKQRIITTPNPEILLETQKKPKFLKILNSADLNIADGAGILWASKFQEITKNTKSTIIKAIKWITTLLIIPFYPKYFRTILPERVTGTDLLQRICNKASESDRTIFLLGAAEGIAKKTRKILEERYQGLKIVGTHSGSPKKEDEESVRKIINAKSPQILFVAFGAPSQEEWIFRNLKNLPSVKVAIGVGGAFDYVAGKRRRAPKFIQKLGLEWLHRLIQEPKRIKRIFNATIKFPLAILLKALKQN